MKGQITIVTIVIPRRAEDDPRARRMYELFQRMEGMLVSREEANRRREENSAASEVQYSQLHGDIVAHDGRPADALRETPISFHEIMGAFEGLRYFGIKKSEPARGMNKVEIRLGTPQEGTPEIPAELLQEFLESMRGWTVSIRQVWENPKDWGTAINLVVGALPITTDQEPQCHLQQVEGRPIIVSRKRVHKDVPDKMEVLNAEAVGR